MKKSLQPIFLSLCFSWIMIISGRSLSATPAPTEVFQENTPASSTEKINNDLLTITEAEKLAGFDIREPAYLPTGVSFDFATYQDSPAPLPFYISSLSMKPMGYGLFLPDHAGTENRRTARYDLLR